MIWSKEKIVAVGVNTAGKEEAALAESGGWLLLAPYGETPYWHEPKPGAEGKVFRQVFTRAQGERMAAVNAQLDAAINAGRLSAAEREGFLGRFERDYEETLRALGERRPALNTQPLGLRPAAAGLDLSTAHGRAAAFNARLDTLMRPLAAGGRGLRFDAAIAEMRGSAEDAELLRAMNGK